MAGPGASALGDDDRELLYDADYERVVRLRCAGLGRESARVYRSHLATWWRWCEQNGRRPWPAAPEDLAEFAAELSARGVRPITLRSRIVTVIGGAHRRAGHEDPAASERVREVLKAADSTPPGRKLNPFLAIEFERLLATLPDTQQGRRNAALLAVLRDARLTHDEASGLIWNDIVRLPDGTGGLRIRWTGEELPISARTLALLDAIRESAHAGSLVFGLGHDRSRPISGSLISLIVRDAAEDAGTLTPDMGSRRGSSRYHPWTGPTRSREALAPGYLREWMAERGWTPDALSVVLGVSPAQLERWRRGRNTPPFHLRRALTMVGPARVYDEAARPPAEPTAAAVRERMAAGGWNDRGLARALGVSEQTIANWRRGATTGPRYLLLAFDGAEAATELAGRNLGRDEEWTRPDQLPWDVPGAVDG